MKQVLVWALLAASWIPVRAAARPVAQDPLFGQIDRIVAELSEISGLQPRGKIRYARISRDQLTGFLEDRIRESVKPEEIQAEEAFLKKFGFAPADFDLKKMTLDLLTEQAAAFYDFHKKKLFVIEPRTGLDERSALVHELAHALADQHFHLEKFIGHGSQNDDAALARLAVMEGQATWLMTEYEARRSGLSLKDSPGLAKALERAGDSPVGQFPVFDRSPLYVQQTLLFPYAKGMLFQQALVEKMGQAAFSEVFRRPPESTGEVIHPERYLEHVKPVPPALPGLPSQRDYRAFTEGEVGELDLSILVRQYVGEAEAAIAQEWRGGYFRLFARKHQPRDWRQMVLVFGLELSSPEQARRCYELYEKVLAAKWKTFEVTGRSSERIEGQGDGGRFVLTVNGVRVTSIEGLPRASATGINDRLK